MNDKFVPLDIGRIRQQVRDLSVSPDLIYFPSVDSTNRVARDLPTTAWRTGTVVVADYQAAGRGRLDRSWTSPPGTSLLFSAMFDLPARVAPTDGIMMMALAVRDGIKAVSRLAPDLKWPNDVLLDGKKICGILADFLEAEERRRLILGVGLNVNFNPADLGLEDATSLAAATGGPVDREKVAAAVLRALDLWYRSLSEDPNAVFEAWARSLETVGRRVVVKESDRSWEGMAVGVERSGGLLVRTPEGDPRPVYAADVSIRRI